MKHFYYVYYMPILSDVFIDKVLNRLNQLESRQLQEFINQLLDERQFFGSILNAMIEGIIALDQKNTLKYINQSALGMLGLTSHTSILGESIFSLLPEAPRELFKEVTQNKTKVVSIDAYKVEVPISKIFQIHAFPYAYPTSESEGQVLMLMDITEKIKEEQKLKEAESLASLTNLAAGVAHEIKNPLGAIDIHIQLMDRHAKKLPIEHRETMQELIDVVADEIHRLDNIVKDFLFTVRPMRIQPKTVDAEELIKDILNTFYYDIKEKEIGINLEVDQNLPEDSFFAFWDARYIKQAFVNLLKNAIEACGHQDKITICLKLDDDHIIVYFSDTGKGIPDNKRDHIFEPYFTTKDFGTGLGLTLTMKIINEHGGDITVKSKEGKGTTFMVRLPKYHKSLRLLSTSNPTVDNSTDHADESDNQGT